MDPTVFQRPTAGEPDRHIGEFDPAEDHHRNRMAGDPTLKKVEGTAVQVAANRGISRSPQDAPDSDNPVFRADVAMYEAKQRGKNRFLLSDPRREQARG